MVDEERLFALTRQLESERAMRTATELTLATARESMLQYKAMASARVQRAEVRVSRMCEQNAWHTRFRCQNNF